MLNCISEATRCQAAALATTVNYTAADESATNLNSIFGVCCQTAGNKNRPKTWAETSSDVNDDLFASDKEAESATSRAYYRVSPRLQTMVARCRHNPRENAALVEQMRAGDKAAKERLVLGNQCIVLSEVAGCYGCGIEADDLFMAGVEGLQRGIERYDPTRGAFFPYVRQWVKKYIIDCVHSDGIICMSKEAYALLKAEYESANGEGSFRPYRVLSLSDPLKGGEDDSYTREETVACYDAEADADYQLRLRERAELVDLILSQLSKRDREIVRMAFGIGYPEAFTQDEIAVKVGLTRQRVGQVIASLKRFGPSLRDAKASRQTVIRIRA